MQQFGSFSHVAVGRGALWRQPREAMKFLLPFLAWCALLLLCWAAALALTCFTRAASFAIWLLSLRNGPLKLTTDH
jgi:hypothetical protein